ncbi:phage portal protein [Fusobacterium sp.]|uniref:phage portal protein n=1 Tax=Fusobacterium sp. TaxID=68766 RepID=UPI001DEF6FF3|nr:phage portal protein [Fusobacterium sp.]MBS5790091.1 phage portal protein [Fusobacterium sp.]
MNVLEKIAPKFMANRERAKRELQLEKYKTEILNYAQHGASTTKNAFREYDDNLYDADEDIGDSKEILMARSRQLYMGNAIAVGAIKKMRTNIIGTGIKLKPKINKKILELSDEEADEIQNRIQTIWELWANSTECDIEKQSNFYQLQSLAFITQMIDGECFVLLPFKKSDFFELKIKLIDSARCVEPYASNVDAKNGVEINADGEVVAYWFINDKLSLQPKRVQVTGKNGRKNVLVLMEKERIGQRRGVPVLAPVIEMLSQITKFTNAELMNAVVSSMFSVFITSQVNANPVIDLFQKENSKKGDKENSFRLSSGMVMQLQPGQDIKFADPGRPNTQFDNFLFSMCKQLGAALEIPVEVLLSNFNASYSASKASLEEVWKMYLMRRSWIVANFCQPIFEEWLDEAVAKGYIKLKGYFDNPLIRKAYQQAEWYGETQSQLDPYKEIKAAELRIATGVSTVAREARAINGSDWKENMEQRKLEIKAMEGLIDDSRE